MTVEKQHPGNEGELSPALGRFRGYMLLLARQQLDSRLHGKLDPSDIVQQTLLEAYKDRGRFRGGSDAELAGWLRRILARNLCDALRQLTAAKRDVAREYSIEQELQASSVVLARWLAAEQSSPSEQAMWHEDLLRLAAALATLPADQRRAVELHHLQGWSLARIAQEMDRGKPAVAGLLHRGMERLRLALAEPESR
jgi:RNA polymerase sigma-70 factor (ECF subfamily)